MKRRSEPLFRGEKIREIRKQKGLTLQELSVQTQVSISLLSQIERGKVDPAVSTFWKICSVLQIPFNEFFDGDHEETIVVRKQLRRVVELSNSNVKYHDLTPQNKSGNLDFILVEIQPGETTDRELISHSGEECGFVLQGELKVFLGEREFDLFEGDSISFSSMTPHRYMNVGKAVSISIWVMSSR